MYYTPFKLRLVWTLFRNGGRKPDLMRACDCTAEEADDMFDQAYKKFGLEGFRRHHKTPEVPADVLEKFEARKVVKTESADPEIVGRPKAEYSNAGYLKTMEKYSDEA